MYNFLVIDDHSLIRLGLRLLLSTEFKNASIEEASNEASAIMLLKSFSFHLVIMDMNMPDSDPVRLVNFINTIHPTTPILVLTVNDENSYALRLYKLGVKGYINKFVENKELINAIRMVMEKRIFMGESLREKLAESYLSNNIDNPFNLLSTREFQVATELLNGKSIPEIAAIFKISTSTVSTYKGKIFAKLGINVNNMIELMKLANMYNIIKPAERLIPSEDEY